MSEKTSERPGIFFRLVSSTLLATSIGVTVILMIIGYELAVWILESGYTHGQTSMVVLAGMPSLCALVSLPFWLTLRRMNSEHRV